MRLLFPALVVSLAVAATALAEDGKASCRPAFAFRASAPGNPHATFEVGNLDPSVLAGFAGDPGRAKGAFTVSTCAGPDDTRADRPPLLGSYEVDAPRGLIRFRSRFPEDAGMHYLLTYREPGSAGSPLRSVVSTPRTRQQPPSTTVTRVSPTRDLLPENTLKFYVEFSAPMARGEAYEHLRLLDAAGKPLDLPFLELGEELWDPRGTRFTLLFDPGRIKTGLTPREELGPVLESGRSYTFVIDSGWRDATGQPLKAGFRKPFRVGPPDRTAPDPASWRVAPPAADKLGPLVLRFPEPLDRAMLGRVLTVVDAGGTPVGGKIGVGDDETSWSFIPSAAWRPGAYAVLVDKALEDLAGNSIGRPFEVDVFEVGKTSAAGVVRLRFDVAPPAR